MLKHRPGPIWWDTMARALMKGDEKRRGLTPAEVWSLTIPEVTLLMSESISRTWSGGQNMTEDEINRYAEWYMSLGQRDRLEAAKRGEL